MSGRTPRRTLEPMGDGHGQYEELVVGHVLDDLAADDAARFRSHLMNCRDCRARVAELRGIAAELADAERDELARAAVRTQAPRRTDQDGPADGPGLPRIRIVHVTIATVIVLAIAGAMGFWNLHLRASAATYLAVAESRGDAIDGLVNDAPLDATFTAPVTGLVTGDGQQVSLALFEVSDPAEGQLYVAWFREADGFTPVRLAGSGQVLDGALAVTLDAPGASELVVTREPVVFGDRPGGDELVRVALRSSR
jgi:hypothetical protein